MNENPNNIPAPAPLPEGEPMPQVTPQMPPPPSAKPSQVQPPPPLPPSPQRFQPSGATPSIPGTPPPPDIGIRTMASDLSSLKSSGGLEAKPTTFKPEEFNKEPIFEIAKPEKGAEGAVKTIQPKTRRVNIFIVLGIIGFVILAGLVIYFFVMPLIFPKENPTTELPGAVETPQVEVEPVPVVSPLIHQSYFITPAVSAIAMNVNSLNLAEINSALNDSAADTQQKTVKEVTLTVSGEVPQAADFLSIAFPELNRDFLNASFEKDFTAFLYRDANGSWPGYVFRLNPNSSLDQVAATMANIETSQNISGLYLSNVVPNSAGFKDGLKVGNVSARYLAMNAPGASFNYVWFNNHLVASTSFDGFREALKLLGSQ